MGRRGNHDKGSFQPDNAARMYSASQGGTSSGVYRFSHVVPREVGPPPLQEVSTATLHG